MESANHFDDCTCEEHKHDEHLCFLMYEGWHFGHRDEYKALAQGADYLCENCGRTAQSAKNLCAPTSL